MRREHPGCKRSMHLSYRVSLSPLLLSQIKNTPWVRPGRRKERSAVTHAERARGPGRSRPRPCVRPQGRSRNPKPGGRVAPSEGSRFPGGPLGRRGEKKGLKPDPAGSGSVDPTPRSLRRPNPCRIVLKFGFRSYGRTFGTFYPEIAEKMKSIFASEHNTFPAGSAAGERGPMVHLD